MAVGRSAVAKFDLNKTITTLGLKGTTASSLTAFKKRNDDARRRVNALSQAPQTVDFAHYRKTLSNTAIIDEIEREFKNFKPATVDVGKQLRAIEQFESQAVKQAEETKVGVQKELRSLEETLGNIESARPFDQLTVDDVVKARPDIDEKVTQLVSKGRWNVPGYKEKFGDLSIL